MKQQNKPLRFAITFVVLFLLFYYFNIWFFSVTNPGARHYIAFLALHLNYIQGLRWLLLYCTSLLLKLLGFSAIFNNYDLLVAGHGIIRVVYTCLGLGVLSFFAAFIFAYPKPIKSKIITLIVGIISIEFLNIIRFILLALYGNKQINRIIDHHTLFNIIMYLIITVALYFWIRQDLTANNKHATN